MPHLAFEHRPNPRIAACLVRLGAAVCPLDPGFGRAPSNDYYFIQSIVWAKPVFWCRYRSNTLYSREYMHPRRIFPIHDSRDGGSSGRRTTHRTNSAYRTMQVSVMHPSCIHGRKESENSTETRGDLKSLGLRRPSAGPSSGL